MKRFLILLTATLVSLYGKSQTAEDSVKAVINKMFIAMKGSDAETLRMCFSDNTVFQTITYDKTGNLVVSHESVNDFIESVSKLPEGSADERVSFETIKIEGPLAMVWAPYTFYYNGQFSHCGMDSFQVVRFNDGWKIQYIIDTRRKQGCQ
ncbi:MAG: nuclear transport factor 2 family protein [Chitinophagales bacterium]|nr:nuclear transport factor 2 family protein [Chitinophagales bacterium]